MGERKLYLFILFPLSLYFGVTQRIPKPFHQNLGFYRAEIGKRVMKTSYESTPRVQLRASLEWRKAGKV